MRREEMKTLANQALQATAASHGTCRCVLTIEHRIRFRGFGLSAAVPGLIVRQHGGRGRSGFWVLEYSLILGDFREGRAGAPSRAVAYFLYPMRRSVRQ